MLHLILNVIKKKRVDILSTDNLFLSDESNKSENEESANNEGKILHTDNFITSKEKGRKHGKSRFNAFFSCYRF